jgi:hypothetical protein
MPHPLKTSIFTLFTLLGTASQLAAAPKDAPSCPKGARVDTARRGTGTGSWCVAPDLMGREQKNGPFKHWRGDGTLEREGEYVDGKRHGRWTEYDASGREARTADYRFGTLLSSSGAADREAPIAEAPRAKPQAEAPQMKPASTSTPERVAAPEPTSKPEPTNDEPVARRDDFEESLETRRGGKSPVGFDLQFENGFSSIQTMVVYAPTMDLTLKFGALGVEAQWGVGVLSAPGLDAVASPLNPTLYLVGQLEYAGIEMKMGVGCTIPILQLELEQDSLLKTAAALMVPSIHGLRDFWLAMPEVPVVVIPIEGRWKHDALTVDFELISYLAIPIHGGSSDLGLQLGAGGKYAIDILRVGAGAHLVMPGVTSGLGILSVTPRVGVALGDTTEIYSSFDATVLRPDALDVGAGFLWSANVGVEVAID